MLGVGETYKHLGFHEAGGLDCAKNKDLLINSYNHRLKLVWNSLLSWPRKTRATNSFCVLLLSYGFSIVPWTKSEIAQFDVSTRKILTATNNHHPRSAVERVYLPRSAGGIVLINIENLYSRKLVLLVHHLCTSSDPLVSLCYELDLELPKRCAIVARAKDYCALISVSTEFQSTIFSSLKPSICDHQFSQLMSTLSTKSLHGWYYSLLNDSSIDKHRSMCWLKIHLHSETESTILAIQDQVIAIVYRHSPQNWQYCALFHKTMKLST